MLKIQIWRFLTALNHPTTVAALVLPIACLVVLWISLRLPSRSGSDPWLRAIAVGCVVLYLAFVGHYLFRPGLYDHVEPAVFEGVRLVLAGEPVYNPPGSVLSIQYGPATFAAPAVAAVLFGLSLPALKAVSVGFAVASLFLLIATLRRLAVPGATAVGVIYFCTAAIVFREKLVWIRGDSQLVFYATLALWGASLSRAPAAFAIVGLAAGAAMAVKVHGAVYVVPAAALLLPRGNLRLWLLGAGLLLLVTFAPFVLFPSYPLSNYIYWLRIAVGHGARAQEAIELVVTAGLMSLPVVFVHLGRLTSASAEERAAWRRTAWLPVVSVVAAVALISIVATKNGAGAYHLLPLVPAGAVAMALAWTRNPAVAKTATAPALSFEGRRPFRAAVVPFMVAGLLGLLAAVIQLRSHLSQGWLQAATRDDVRALAKRHAGESIVMGYGGDQSYGDTFFRTELPLTEHRLPDAVALMDMKHGGLPIPRTAYETILSGAIRHVLIPRDEAPFTLKDFYDEKDLFGSEWRETFHRRYQKSTSTGYFDVWTSR